MSMNERDLYVFSTIKYIGRAAVAQLLEHSTLKHKVKCSSLTQGANVLNGEVVLRHMQLRHAPFRSHR